MTVNIGIIGCGIGKQHAKAVAEVAGARVLAFADLDEETCKQTCAEFGAEKAYVHHLELVSDPEIDAVVVTVGTNLHGPVALDALGAGKHVMIEKPPAHCAADVAKLRDAAKQKDRVLAFNFQRRHDPVHREAHRLIQAGAIGRVYHARAVWFVPKFRKGGADWAFSWSKKGAALGSMGSHYLDWCWWLMGCPKVQWVAAHASTYFCAQRCAEDPGDDLMAGLIMLEDGKSITLETSRRLHRAGMQAGEVFGTEGSYSEKGEIYRQPEEGEPVIEPIAVAKDERPDSQWIWQMQHFVEAVRGERSAEINADQAYEFQRMLDGLYDSARTGQPVMLG